MLVLKLAATLTDESLDVFEHGVGKLSLPNQSVSTTSLHRRAINEKVRLYTQETDHSFCCTGNGA
jgi:hypothetical protein